MERHLLIHRVRYGYWYNCLQEVLHRRIAFWTNFIQLIAGCSAIAGLAGDDKQLIAWASGAAAACALLSLLLNPASKEWQFRQMKCKFLELREEETSLSNEDLNRAIIRLQREGETGLTFLANPATNRARTEMGYKDQEDFVKLGPLEWVASKLAH